MDPTDWLDGVIIQMASIITPPRRLHFASLIRSTHNQANWINRSIYSTWLVALGGRQRSPGRKVILLSIRISCSICIGNEVIPFRLTQRKFKVPKFLPLDSTESFQLFSTILWIGGFNCSGWSRLLFQCYTDKMIFNADWILPIRVVISASICQSSARASMLFTFNGQICNTSSMCNCEPLIVPPPPFSKMKQSIQRERKNKKWIKIKSIPFVIRLQPRGWFNWKTLIETTVALAAPTVPFLLDLYQDLA